MATTIEIQIESNDNTWLYNRAKELNKPVEEVAAELLSEAIFVKGKAPGNAPELKSLLQWLNNQHHDQVARHLAYVLTQYLAGNPLPQHRDPSLRSAAQEEDNIINTERITIR